jgi:pilus assembly protein Flp/PilA
MTKMVKRFLTDESGATAIEYGLIAAGISVAIIGALTATKDKLAGTFTKVQNALN